MTQKGLVRRTHRQSLVPQGLQRAWQQRGHPGPQPQWGERKRGMREARRQARHRADSSVEELARDLGPRGERAPGEQC